MTPFFVSSYFIYLGQIRLHTENELPMLSGSALKVRLVVVVVGGPTNNHVYPNYSWVELGYGKGKVVSVSKTTILMKREKMSRHSEHVMLGYYPHPSVCTTGQTERAFSGGAVQGVADSQQGRKQLMQGGLVELEQCWSISFTSLSVKTRLAMPESR